MNQKIAYEQGLINGYGIADSNIYLELDSEGFCQEDLDNFFDLCIETESDHFRQFSPFEFFAKEINDSKYPDAIWDKYDRGVEVGIRKCIRGFKRDNKSNFIKENQNE